MSVDARRARRRRCGGAAHARLLAGAVAGADVNFADRGIQLTRPARALKLWLSLKYFGVGAFRDAVDRSLDLALLAESRIRESATLELLAPV